MISFFSACLQHKMSTLFTAIILCVLTFIGLLQIKIGPNNPNDNIQFSVIIQQFGLDGKEIEHSITTPLEHLITRISGIKELRSVSEKNKSRVNIILNSNTNSNEFYFSLREAVDILYTDLPASVQRPQIFSITTSQRPFFIVTFPADSVDELNKTYDLVEENLKQRIQKIQGVGEINIGGNEPKEIHIVVNNEKTNQYKISYQQISQTIQSNYQESTVGILETGTKDIPIVFKGRLDTLEQLSFLYIPLENGNIIQLKDIADISYSRRTLEKISRVDGTKNIALYIKSSDAKYIVSASNHIKKELSQFQEQYPITYNILYDYGQNFSNSTMNIVKSLAQSMLLISLFLFLYYRNILLACIISIFLPIEILLSIAILNVLGLYISLELLIGISISIGLLTDTGVIIINEIHNHAIDEIPQKMARTTPPLFASIITTLIAMTPLFFLPPPIKTTITPIVISMYILFLTTFLLHICFFPPLYSLVSAHTYTLKIPNIIPQRVHTYYIFIKTKGVSIAQKCINICYHKAKYTSMSALGLIMIFFISLLLIPQSTNTSILEEPIIFGSIEFDSGTSVLEVDKETNKIINEIYTLDGIERVESLANKNKSTISIKFDTSTTLKNKLIEQLRELNNSFPGTSIIINDTAKKETKLEIALIGQDTEKLRSYAKDLAQKFLANPIVTQSIMHFKEGEPVWQFDFYHDQALSKGISAKDINAFLRWNLYGPVSLKWFDTQEEKERDLRIKGEYNINNKINNIRNYNIQGKNNVIPIHAIGTFKLIQKPDTIFHLNKQRAVYFSLLLSENDINKIFTSIKNDLHQYSFPKGYSYRLDKSLQELKHQYRLLVALIIIAIVVLYMFLAGYYETVITPIIIIISIPLSLSIISITYLIFRKNFSTYSFVAIIIVIGLVVNNIILFLDKILEQKNNIHILQALKERSAPVLITSLSTLFSLIPMLFSKSNSVLVFEFSLILLLGIIGSIITTFLIIPALLALFPKLIPKNKLYHP